jgi:DNA polymerase
VPYQLLFLDYETVSLEDLREVGLDNYAKHSSTGLSMLGWAFDNEEVELWLPHLGPMPQKLVDGLRDPAVIKIAWNAPFEFNITRYVTDRIYFADAPLNIPISQFRDPMVLAHALSLPGKLEDVAIILKMQQLKDPRGEELKQMFCKPVNKGGQQTLFGIAPPLFRDHNSHPKEYAEYGEYCKQDVRAERDLWYRLQKIAFPEREWQGWLLDQKINDFGIPGRRDLAEKGLRLALRFIDDQKKLLKTLTGLENPNSDTQMKAWLESRGYPWNSLRANQVQAELNNPESKLTPEARTALKARASARKTSYTKIEKFLLLLSADDRLRNQLRFLGAPRTGRWASGGGDDPSMQVQNLPRGTKAVKKRLDFALTLLAAEDYEGIVREFTDTKDPKDSITVIDFVISLLRSLFQAGPGKTFMVADKNAIENRMLGWAAGCDKILDVFRQGRCPYMSFGVELYGIPYEEWYVVDAHGNHKPKNAEFEEKRQNSKPPVLGGGYALGGGEMFTNEYGDEVRGGLWGYALSVCGVDMPKELAHKAVKILRDAWPEVVQLWLDLEEAFKQVLKRGGVIKVGEVTWDKQAREWVEHPTKGKQCVLTFRRIKMPDGGYTIQMMLPSGRALHYLNATIEEEQKTSQRTGNPYTVYTIYYDGIEHSATQGADGKNIKKHHKWGRVKTYGGKLCLSGATQVITPRGLKRLDETSLDDWVWDGVEWVQHSGLLCNGLRETQTWMGLTGTSDHQILGGSEWHELGKTTNQNGLCSLLTGLASALRMWCSLNRASMAALGCDVTADRFLMSELGHCGATKSTLALPAAANTVQQVEPKDSGTTSSSTRNSDNSGSGNFQTSSPDVTIPNALHTAIMGDGVFNAMSLGGEAGAFGLSTQSHCRDGIIRLWNLIESTTKEITNREISGSSLAQRIQIIVEQLSGLSGLERNFPTKSFASDLLRFGARTLSIIISSADAQLNGVSPDMNKRKVYDLRDCGPRHRFMVMTNGGPVLAHNCENAVQAMSRDDLLNSMFLADEMDFGICGLFHDEILCEVDDDPTFGPRLSDLLWCMTRVPDWAPGLLLGAEGFVSPVYKKG